MRRRRLVLEGNIFVKFFSFFMSRIGKLPVAISSGVTAEILVNKVLVKGSKGSLAFPLLAGISVREEEGRLLVSRENDEKATRAYHGLTRAMLANMVEGVSKGFEKRLEIIGVGYRAQASGSKITLSLGFSHPVEMDAPKGVTVEMDPDTKNKNVVIIRGIDKQAVGEFAANIRKLRKPEPYKGKGIRYSGEFVKRKAGKSAGKK